MRNAIIYREPKLRPLPGEITTQQVNEAILPRQIEAARRALAECTDLSELLQYRNKAEGLAAAVRILKHVAPEMVRDANLLVKESTIKAAEALAQYSNVPIAKGRYGNASSPRTVAAIKAGLTPREQGTLGRIGDAPRAVKERILADVEPIRIKSTEWARDNLPPRKGCTGTIGKKPASEALRRIMSVRGIGITNVMATLRSIPLDAFAQLTPDERKIVRAKITECMELLDRMDQLCR